MNGRLASVMTAGVMMFAVATIVATPAGAADRVDHQAWSRSTPVPTFMAQANEIYVGLTAGVEEARSYLHIAAETSSDKEAMAQSTITLQEAADAILPTGATLSACASSDSLSRDGELSGGLPHTDCTLRVDASRDPSSGRWTIPLGVFAERWAGGSNFSIVILPNASGPTEGTFRAAFDTTKTAILSTSGTSDTQASTGTPADSEPLVTGPQASNPNGVFGDGQPAAVPMQTATAVGADPGGQPRPALAAPDARNASSPAAPGGSNALFTVLVLLGIVMTCAAVVAMTPLRRRVVTPAALYRRSTPPAAILALLTVVVLAPLLGREVIIYKAGLLLVFLVAALGLHVLVNWTGQLSLAHAEMVGLPAFLVMALSQAHNLSPLYLLPLAPLMGAAVGAIVGLPTLRAKGMQVALVTLVAGIAIDQFLFTRPEIVGPIGGRTSAPLSLGPIEFTTSRSLYPLLVLLVALTFLGAWALMHSKVARAWFWIRADPDAAAAFGIRVVAYRVLAYAIGGAFAGFAGGLLVVWAQHLSASQFPTTLSFTYLLVVVLAGPGFAGGLGLAALVIEGGLLFSSNLFGTNGQSFVGTLIAYGGPLNLIFVITRYQSGFNGVGRRLMQAIQARQVSGRLARSDEPEPISIMLIAGVVAVIAGFVAIGLAWHHAGRTAQLWVQNQELISGGLGGLALILLGIGLLIREVLTRNQLLLVQELRSLLAVPDQEVASPTTPMAMAESAPPTSSLPAALKGRALRASRS